jgi:hypothetical protein
MVCIRNYRDGRNFCRDKRIEELGLLEICVCRHVSSLLTWMGGNLSGIHIPEHPTLFDTYISSFSTTSRLGLLQRWCLFKRTLSRPQSTFW